jgi:hypothetical protein
MRVDEAVVHDLSHELGNYFHKLYYWTDCVRSGADDPAAGASPADALDETLHRLQEFLNLALEYFQPATLNLMRLTVGDVARAFEAQIRGENPEAAVATSCGGEIAPAAVLIDTTRLSLALRLVARLLGGSELQATFGRTAPGDVLEIAVLASGASTEAAARRAQRVVEWAVAARMLEMHGGDLVADEQRPGSASCVLHLPLAT